MILETGILQRLEHNSLHDLPLAREHAGGAGKYIRRRGQVFPRARADALRRCCKTRGQQIELYHAIC